MRRYILLISSIIYFSLASLFAQTVASQRDAMGNIPSTYKAFVLVNKLGFVLSPDPVKYQKGEPNPALILLSGIKVGDLVFSGRTYQYRIFNLLLSNTDSPRALFISSDVQDPKLIFTETKFVQAESRMEWLLHPVQGTKYCQVISNDNTHLVAGTDGDGNLMIKDKVDGSATWELIRVK